MQIEISRQGEAVSSPESFRGKMLYFPLTVSTWRPL
jgi:hypothetical protein